MEKPMPETASSEPNRSVNPMTKTELPNPARDLVQQFQETVTRPQRLMREQLIEAVTRPRRVLHESLKETSRQDKAACNGTQPVPPSAVQGSAVTTPDELSSAMFGLLHMYEMGFATANEFDAIISRCMDYAISEFTGDDDSPRDSKGAR